MYKLHTHIMDKFHFQHTMIKPLQKDLSNFKINIGRTLEVPNDRFIALETNVQEVTNILK